MSTTATDVAPKRRGRPPKNVDVEHIEEKPEAQTPAKRGRPRKEDAKVKRFRGENGEPIPIEAEEKPAFEQPALVTGARLKNYQLEGLQWMVSLDQNGISGILGT